MMIRTVLLAELKRQGVKLSAEQIRKCVLELKEVGRYELPSIAQFVSVIKEAMSESTLPEGKATDAVCCRECSPVSDEDERN